MNFGVFYTCFTEKKAVEYSLDVLYELYPDIKVYLVSDGGEDFSFLNEKFKTIETFLESDSRGFIPSLINNPNFYEKEVQDKVKDSILTFLNRVNRAIDFCQSDYLLVMEPDVLVRGKISNPQNKKLLGSRINSGLSSDLKKILSDTEGAIVIDNWGVTPAIFECNSFKKAYEKLLNTPNLLNNLCLSEKRLANYDVLFAVLFSLIGVEESFNPEIVECFRTSEWEYSSHPLVHQYRAKYPTKSEGYNGTHIINEHGLGDKWFWNR